MKSILEVYARAIVLICLYDRGCLEYPVLFGIRHSKAERIKQRTIIIDWMESGGFTKVLTYKEKEFMYALIGEPERDAVIESDFMYQAVVPCLWALSLTEGMPNYDSVVTTDYRQLLLGDVEKTFGKCNLKEESSIKRQCNVAKLWHWRLELEKNEPYHKPLKRGELGELVVSRFGETYRSVINDILGGQDDFQLYSQISADRTLNHVEILSVKETIVKWRYHALEWILSDKGWDEIKLGMC